MRKTALITGISGQDGSYLTELLLEKGYRVCGVLRRHSEAESQDRRITHLGDQVETVYGDLTDYGSLVEAVRWARPDEVYNLGAMSHVRVSFDKSWYTVQVNAVGVLNMLEAVRHHAPAGARYYQASSSEMFGLGVDPDGRQRETTVMNPTSPYGCAKVFGYNATRHYRRAYRMFCCNGILFNHGSQRRGATFIEMKVVKTAVEIKHGLAEKLVLGNLDSQRDWGHSRDYVRAMWLMLQQPTADDYVWQRVRRAACATCAGTCSSGWIWTTGTTLSRTPGTCGRRSCRICAGTAARRAGSWVGSRSTRLKV